MNLTIFIFFNIIIAGLYVYSRFDDDLGYLYKIIAALFSLLIVGGLASGVTGSFDNGCDIFKQKTDYIYGNNFSGFHWDYVDDTAPPQFSQDVFLFHTQISTYETVCTENDDAFGVVTNGVLILLYLLIALGLIVLSSMELSELSFNGGRNW